jgi:Tfp pilus assembly protein PilX
MKHRYLWSGLAREEGSALALAFGVLLVLAITTAGLMTLATSNFRSATHTRAWESAVLAAEGGIDEALARLNNGSDPNNPTLLASTTTTIGAATVGYSGSYESVYRRWTVTSTATLPAPNGGSSPVSRTVRQTLQVRSGPATAAANPAWGYIYADGTTGCTTLNSGVRIKQPVYVRNSLCLNNNVLIHAVAGSVQVGGANGITMNGSAAIGVADDGVTPQALPELYVASQGCRFASNPYSWPCSGAAPPAGQRVLASSQSVTLTGVTKPPIDLVARYYDAAPGPAYPCGAGSFGLASNFFENNAVVNDRSAGTRYLLPTSDYSCVVPGLGSLSWDYNPVGPGTLTIDGTVFIDGDVFFNNSRLVDVAGSGTIYASGNVRLESNAQICGKWDSGASTCDWATWTPGDGALFLVAGHSGSSTTMTLDSGVRF